MTIFRNGIPEANPEEITIKVLREHVWQPSPRRVFRGPGSCACGWAQGGTGELNHPLHVACKLAAAEVTHRPRPDGEEDILVAEIRRLNKKIGDARESLMWQLRQPGLPE